MIVITSYGKVKRRVEYFLGPTTSIATLNLPPLIDHDITITFLPHDPVKVKGGQRI